MTIEKVVQYWYTTSRSVLLKYKGSDGYLYVGKGRVERTYFFYLFLAFRDRCMQVKVSIKWYLKVHGNVQIGTKRDTFAQVNRLTSEFESCIVHHRNCTEKCSSFLLSNKFGVILAKKVTAPCLRFSFDHFFDPLWIITA